MGGSGGSGPRGPRGAGCPPGGRRTPSAAPAPCRIIHQHQLHKIRVMDKISPQAKGLRRTLGIRSVFWNSSVNSVYLVVAVLVDEVGREGVPAGEEVGREDEPPPAGEVLPRGQPIGGRQLDHVPHHVPQRRVLNLGQDGCGVVLAAAVGQQLRQVEESLAVREELRDAAAHAEDVRCGGEASLRGGPPPSAALVEALRSDVAPPPPAGVEEEGKVRRVVCRQMGRLEVGEVGEEDPVPGGDKHVLELDVPMTDPAIVALRGRE
eukprot:1186731-Prorocentrum_minimum.AAC.2